MAGFLKDKRLSEAGQEGVWERLSRKWFRPCIGFYRTDADVRALENFIRERIRCGVVNGEDIKLVAQGIVHFVFKTSLNRRKSVEVIKPVIRLILAEISARKGDVVRASVGCVKGVMMSSAAGHLSIEAAASIAAEVMMETTESYHEPTPESMFQVVHPECLHDSAFDSGDYSYTSIQEEKSPEVNPPKPNEQPEVVEPKVPVTEEPGFSEPHTDPLPQKEPPQVNPPEKEKGGSDREA